MTGRPEGRQLHVLSGTAKRVREELRDWQRPPPLKLLAPCVVCRFLRRNEANPAHGSLLPAEAPP